jgi:outer membrane protein
MSTTLTKMALAAAFVAFTASKAEAAEPLIGYVNMQRAILEVEEGKRAKSDLRKKYEAKQKELTKREQELKALQEAIQKESVVKDDEATRQRRLEFQTKYLELQQIFMKESQELQQLQEKEIRAIQVKMRKVIDGIGKSEGYTLILEIQENRLLFAKAHLDITNQVIRKYNAKYK